MEHRDQSKTFTGEHDSIAGVEMTVPINDTEKMPRLRAAAIIVQDESILLVRHVKGDATYWLLPGGGVHYGEALDEALRRELQEEACVDIEVGTLVLAVDSIPPDSSRHTLHLCFTAKILQGIPRCGSDERVVEVQFIPIEKLETLPFFPDVRDLLLKAIRNGFPDRAVYAGKIWKT